MFVPYFKKNVGVKCKECVEYNRHEHVMDLWNKIMFSNKELRFVEHLKHFEVVCADIPLFVQYVPKTWLAPYKERFDVGWTNKVTNLGNTTTNRYIYVTLIIL